MTSPSSLSWDLVKQVLNVTVAGQDPHRWAGVSQRLGRGMRGCDNTLEGHCPKSRPSLKAVQPHMMDHHLVTSLTPQISQSGIPHWTTGASVQRLNWLQRLRGYSPWASTKKLPTHLYHPLPPPQPPVVRSPLTTVLSDLAPYRGHIGKMPPGG